MAAVARTLSQENDTNDRGLAEDEPLLGRIGDASQPEDEGIYSNLVLGTLVAPAVPSPWAYLPPSVDDDESKPLTRKSMDINGIGSGTAILAQIGVWIV